MHPTQGSNSDCTKLLQGQLVRLKFLDKGKNGGQIDGVYGPNTAAAIRVAETFYKFRYPDDSAEFCTANILDYAEQVGRDNVNAVISYGQRYFKSCY